MKYFTLDQEEQQILQDFENNEFVEVKDASSRKDREYAAATLNKTKNINIRLPEKTIFKLKAIAAGNNIPYQTLVASVLHRFTKDRKEFSL